MALKGNLRDFSITQLLNLVNLARKTGTIAIEGSKDTAIISFRNGKLAYSKMGRADNHLATILFRSKKISRSQHNMIRTRAGNMSDKELGLLLVNANYITQQDILASLQTDYVGNIQRLFTWADGRFSFENGLLPPNGKILLRINLENIIIEGSRQLREWEQLQDEIPSLDIALKFSDRPGSKIKNVNLSVEEWRVVKYIDPKNSIRQIANTTKMNDLEIRRIIYSLLQAGLIEMVRQEGVQVKPLQVGLPATDTSERKSLVNRIIDRIRSI
jgi:hypothetical protein